MGSPGRTAVVLSRCEWEKVAAAVYRKAHADYNCAGRYDVEERRLAEEVCRQAGIDLASVDPRLPRLLDH